jgi:FkbM family methyltransferase
LDCTHWKSILFVYIYLYHFQTTFIGTTTFPKSKFCSFTILRIENSKMEKRLIFDIGMHIGQDSANYLDEGFRVVAIEANPLLVEQNTKKFKKHIDDGSLTILNVGISDKEGVLPFYINQKTSEWSSFDFQLGSRNNTPYEVKNIPCVTTASLFQKYGLPYYLKVDIEGYDFYCINDLPDVKRAPGVKYVSCEATDISLLETLHEKGYTKFKLLHQGFNFTPINLKLERNPLFPKFLFLYSGVRLKFRNIIRTKYPYSSSGPIPEKTKGEWLSYEETKHQFNSFYRPGLGALNDKSWFDFHATY